MKRAGSTLLLAAALLLAAHARGQSELGLGRMWTFERPPLDWLQQQHGFAPDAGWLQKVMLASLKFGRTCSASFVSPAGLILTNHHCVREAIATAGGEAWLRDGFVAARLEDEVPLPGLTVQQLVRTTDVTAAVEEGVAAEDAPAVAEQKRRANQERVLLLAEQQAPGLRVQLVKLFHGALWQLYHYRVHDDLRLVMAPHLQVAHFGGDPDNFTYPRHAIDFAFCRAYAGGKPADTREHYLRWSRGAEEGELVFLVGNPGSTQRLLSVAQLEYLRDVRYPRVRELIDSRLAILREALAAGGEGQAALRSRILGHENGRKLYRGEHQALLDPAFLQRKAVAERELRQRLAAVPELQQRYGGLFDDLAAVALRKRQLDPVATFHTAAGWPLLARAVLLLQFAASGEPAKGRKVREVRVASDPLRARFFADHLQRARKWLPADDPFLRLLPGTREPAALVAELERQSRLGDDEFVDGLVAAGAEAVACCDDPLLQLARGLLPLLERARADWEALEAEEDGLGARLGRAVFAVYGDRASPDATGTLRFSDGRVLGYECNGSVAPWRTSFFGLYARHAEFGGRPPFDLPAAWLARQARIDMAATVDFVCTADSTGGNSGSPVVNARAELVGLLFDGNIESLANEFLFGEGAERSVCVHPQAILEALTKVYDAERLAAELAVAR